MKRLILILMTACITLMPTAYAQAPSTFKFLGIPVDGPRSDMIMNLNQKGFTYNQKDDMLTGRFNGINSNIFISENNGRVDRIMVCDEDTSDASQIRIRFNNLIGQLRANGKYIEIHENEFIPEGENIQYEMSLHNKVYDATFYLDPTYDWKEEDIERFKQTLTYELQRRLERGEFGDNPTETMMKEWLLAALTYRIEEMITGCVWIRIQEFKGRYFISIYYDNLRNRPNGEDL